MRPLTLSFALLAGLGCRAASGGPDPVLQLEIILPLASVAHGQPVGVTLKVSNPSTREVVIRRDCGAAFAVFDSQGKQVYPFAASPVVTCVTPDEPLAAGASVTKRLAWPTHRVSPTETNGVVIFVDPGEYEVRASVRETLSSGVVKATPKRVRLVAAG